MENNKENNSIKSELLEKIKEGRASMKPRWYFVLESATLLLVIFLISLILLGLISFVFFILRQSGATFAPGFGYHGIGVFARAIPWMLVLFGFSLFVVLEILMKNYAFAYRKPVLYSFVFLFFFVFGGGFLMHWAQIHERAFDYAVEHKIPVFGNMYSSYGRIDNKEIHPGIVSMPMNRGFYMVKRNGIEVYVVFLENTRYPAGSAFITGDNVVVMGEEEAGEIKAFGVRKVEPSFIPMRSGMMNFKLYVPTR